MDDATAREQRSATPEKWTAIAAAKRGPCRICCAPSPKCVLHHLVRPLHNGGDVAANIVPVCIHCRAALCNRAPAIVRILLSRLSDAEYAYLVTKGGADYAERVYGIAYERNWS